MAIAICGAAGACVAATSVLTATKASARAAAPAETIATATPSGGIRFLAVSGAADVGIERQRVMESVTPSNAEPKEYLDNARPSTRRNSPIEKHTSVTLIGVYRAT